MFVSENRGTRNMFPLKFRIHHQMGCVAQEMFTYLDLYRCKHLQMSNLVTSIVKSLSISTQY